MNSKKYLNACLYEVSVPDEAPLWFVKYVRKYLFSSHAKSVGFSCMDSLPEHLIHGLFHFVPYLREEFKSQFEVTFCRHDGAVA